MLDRGDGAYVWTVDGERFLDGLSGLFCNNLGHGRTDLVEAMAAQAARLPFGPCWGMTHTAAVAAADAVTGYSPDGLDRVFFVSSGSEAVESAIEAGPLLPRGQRRAAADHASSPGAGRTTAPRWAHCPRRASRSCALRSSRSSTASSTRPTRGRSTTRPGPSRTPSCALGRRRCRWSSPSPCRTAAARSCPRPGTGRSCARICDRHGVLLCADEVITGFGRIGAQLRQRAVRRPAPT